MNSEALFREIEGIDIERKRLREETQKLNKRREDYLNRIVEAAQQRGEETVTYKDKVYRIKPKKIYARKGNAVRRQDAVQALKNYVDDDAEQVYDDLTVALRGEEKIKYVLGK
jgi:seryl-tRNA synthetase